MAEGDTSIDVAKFLQSNSELFVVLGVFSGLAIYISQISAQPLPESAREIRVGFAGALILSFLTLVLVYQQLIREAGSFASLVDAHADLSNWDLILFTVGTILLSPSLVLPILDRVSAIYYLIALGITLTGIPFCARVVRRARSALPESQPARLLSIVAFSAISFAIADKIVRYIQSHPRATGLEVFTLTNLLPPVIDALGVIAVLVRVIAIAAVIFAIGDYFDLQEES